MLLVINGDFVDFLAEQGAVVFNLKRSADMLREILGRAPFDKVLQGLQKFLKADGAQLAITLGNHDVELALPETGRVLVQLLTDNKAALEGKIELCFDGWGYRFQVGGRRALCLHGNEADEYNFTRYDELDRIVQDLHLFDQSDFGADWSPSAGSWFVVNALNPIKQQYPFIDLLKPERPLAATVLAVLDPRKVAYVDQAAAMVLQATKNELARPASQRRMLSAPTSAAQAEMPPGAKARSGGRGLSEADIEGQVELALASGTIDELIYQPGDGQMLGWREWTAPLRDAVGWMKDKAVDVTNRVGATLSETAHDLHAQALQKAIRSMVTDDPYDVGALDDADQGINRGVRADYDVVFAGHTHFRRIAPRPNAKGYYVNTGTWAGLMSLKRSLVDSVDFRKVYDALWSGKRTALYDAGLVRKECTIARIWVDEARNVVTVTLGGVNESRAVQFPDEMTRDLKDQTGAATQ